MLQDRTITDAISALQNAGGNVYAVGGYVRDTLIGVEPKDVDLLVTNLGADEVESALEKLHGRVDYTGKSFGVFRYRNRGVEVEIALPRQEISTGTSHTDFNVRVDHTLSVEDDLYRRDFTVNAMAIQIDTNKVIDPFCGESDIHNKILRCVSLDSLSEDPIRILRALVLHSRYGFTVTDETRFHMTANAKNLEVEAPERIQYELDKLMESKNPAAGIRLAHETGVLRYILPEVADCMGYDQNNPHHEQELGNHLISVLERVSEKTNDPDIRMAALLHDIGKPKSAWVDPETGSNHFYEKHMDDGTILGADHETVGWMMSIELLRRLKYSNDRVRRISDLVKFHMYAPFTSPKGARKFINRVGEYADDLLIIRWGDQGGKSSYPTRDDDKFDLENEALLLEKVRDESQPTDVSQLAINGNDLIQAGYPQGPGIGKILDALTLAVLDRPILNERETLLELAKEAHDAAPAQL